MTNKSLLKGKIREKGYTQAEMASRLSISHASMNYKINNKRTFTVEEIIKLCRILEISDKDVYFFNWHVAKSATYHCQESESL